MGTIDPTTLSPVDRYRLLIGSVVPRPIAWITTVNGTGVVNLAPFSFFNGITSSPLTVMVAIGPRQPAKDTLTNLRDQGEAVIHVVGAEQMADCHQSGGEYAQTVSEVEQLGLATTPAQRVKPPRLVDSPLALECRYVQELALGEPATTVVFLEVLLVHVDDGVAAADGFPDPQRYQPVARLGERSYLAGDGWQVVEMGKQQVPPDLARPRPPR